MVRALSIATSFEAPVDVAAKVLISEINLRQKPWQLSVIITALWAMYAILFAYRRFKKLTPVKKPVLITNASYEQVQLDSKRERERQALLNFLSTAYVDPTLELDTLVAALGMNRTKINDILREETGLTFSNYVNQLRLAEAARLITETDMGVAEAAYKVGYSNVSYFNRIFKKQFGTTPSLYHRPKPE
jgi:AraC-like DNA-binding protein